MGSGALNERVGTSSAGVLDVGEYCRRVESHLTRVNGGHLVRIVGPGFELVRGWAQAGVPLRLVQAAIDAKAARHHAGAAAARPLRIEFCESEVRATYERWRRAVGVAPVVDAGHEAGSDEEGGRRPPSLSKQLARAVDRLGDAAGRVELPEDLHAAIARVLDELIALREAARHARGPAREPLLARLGPLDADLIAAARATAPADLLATLRLEAESELAPFRGRLDPAQWDHAVDVTLDRLLREHRGLPTLVR